MCNGQPFSMPPNWRHELPVDTEAAAAIAKLAAEKADVPLCPLIGKCHQDCLSILNQNANASLQEHVTCYVDVLCQDPQKFAYGDVAIPSKLLAK